jgi:hypothetical protein
MTGGGQAKRAMESRRPSGAAASANLNDYAMLAALPTPQTHDDKLRGNTEADCHYSPHDLSNAAILSSVPTPMAGSPATETYNAAGNTDYSRRIVELASVATPDTGMGPHGRRGQSSNPEHQSARDLEAEAKLQAVTTHSARGWKDTSGMSESGVDPDGSTRTRLDQLPRQAQLAASGPTATGGSGATASTGPSGKESIPSSGQLNAGYSRWLQGVPVMWDYFVIQAAKNLKQRKRG